MKLYLYYVGKPRDAHANRMAEDYVKRSDRYARTSMREIHPDLVVSDILMPRVDGYDLCRRLRAAPETALLPLILVTSLDAQGERIKGLEAGADDFLSKPFNRIELMARLHAGMRILNLHRALTDRIQELHAMTQFSGAPLTLRG